MSERNPKAVALYVNVPRNKPNIAKAMREGAQEIDRLEAALADEKLRHAKGLEAWRENNRYQAERIAMLQAGNQ